MINPHCGNFLLLPTEPGGGGNGPETGTTGSDPVPPSPEPGTAFSASTLLAYGPASPVRPGIEVGSLTCVTYGAPKLTETIHQSMSCRPSVFLAVNPCRCFSTGNTTGKNNEQGVAGIDINPSGESVLVTSPASSLT